MEELTNTIIWPRLFSIDLFQILALTLFFIFVETSNQSMAKIYGIVVIFATYEQKSTNCLGRLLINRHVGKTYTQVDFCYLWINIKRRNPAVDPQMFWYCQNVCFGEVCWWIAGWHVENYWTRIFAQTNHAAAKLGFCDNGNNWPPVFAGLHIYVWMNWCWLMMIEDSSKDDNTNLGPCIFATSANRHSMNMYIASQKYCKSLAKIKMS